MKINKREDIGAVLIIASLYLLMSVLGVGCPIAFLTGISCAGCGMTRAWLAAFQGDVRLAMYYHPLFWMVIPLIIWFLTGQRMNRRLYRVGLAVFAILFILLYIWRMLWGDGTIVYFHPLQGAIAGAYRKIFSFIGGYL